ncbi:MAG TPA: DUF1206 domain-containing protein [Acidimicrobiales bacterium]|nr:DUF1206 domain-containing protein [Acidimicrobiales bacterium]
MTAVADKAEDVTDEIREGEWPERIGRVGLFARGVIYAAVAVLALKVAFGDNARSVDKDGALEGIASSGVGRIVLVVLAVGFACYAAWRLMKAIVGAGEGSGRRRGLKGGLQRALDVVRAGIYISLLVSTVDVIADGAASGKSNDAQAHDRSAQLMASAAGRWVVIAVGLALVATGVVLVVRAIGQKFEKHLDRRELAPWERTWLPRLGALGYGSRGVVASIIGGFVAHAGLTYDPNDAVGLDGALRRVAAAAYGPWLLTAVAVGLLAFSAYSLVEARYRKVLDD